jgi:hypothetical protein
VIDIDEFTAACDHLGLRLTHPDVEALFGALDTEGTGLLRFEEFSELLREARFELAPLRVPPRKGTSLSPNVKSHTTTPRFGDYDAYEETLRHERSANRLTPRPERLAPSLLNSPPVIQTYGKQSKPKDNISDLIAHNFQRDYFEETVHHLRQARQLEERRKKASTVSSRFNTNANLKRTLHIQFSGRRLP